MQRQTRPTRSTRSFGVRAALCIAGFLLAGAGAAMAYFVVSIVYANGNYASAQATTLQAPTGATTADAGSSAVTVSWTNPGSQLAGAAYRVTASPGSQTCTSSGTTCQVSGLSPATTYSFSVVAALDNWTTSSTSAPFTTLGVTTSSLPQGTYGSTYSTSLAATGGSGGYTWSVTGGTLPSWAHLNASTGVITGTPNAAGTTSGLAFTAKDSSGFTAASSPLSLVVNTATLTVTASNGTMIYGGTPPVITAGYSGFANGDQSTSLTTQANCSTTATSTSSVVGSPYPSSCSGAVDANYTFNYVNGTVTVSKAPLTVTASNTTSTYGGTPPAPTAGYSGFVNGQGAGNLTTAPTCSTTVTATSSLGAHSGSNTCSGGVSPNYSFSYVAGTDTVGPATLTVTASTTFTAFGATPAPTPGYSGFVNGQNSSVVTTAPTCTSTVTSTTAPNTYSGANTCSGGAATNYTLAYVAGTATVTKANQTISFTSTNPSPVTPASPNYTPTATSTSGLGVSISLDASSTGCTISGGVVDFTAKGTCIVDANQVGNGNYNSTAQVQQSITVTSSPGVKLVITSAAFTGTASTSATNAFTVTLEDGSGNATTSATPTTVGLSSTSNGAKFAASSNGSGVSSVTLPASATSVTAYYGDTVAGDPTITASSGTLTQGTQAETINGSSASQIAFATPAQSGVASNNANLGPITLQTEDQFGNPVNASSNVSIGLSSTGSTSRISFSTTFNGSGQSSSTVNIPSGSSSVNFYYGYNSVSTQTISANPSTSGWATVTQTESIVSPPSITTTNLPVATKTQTGYSATLAETGGVSPFTWSVISGALPSGLSLDPNTGIISGVVSATASSQTFTVEVTDSKGLTDTQSLTLTVNSAPSITTTLVPAADNGQSGYSTTLAETGGTSGFTWTLSSGSLPSGLSLSSGGVISGNVGSSATTSTLTVKVTDANGVFATQSLTLTVNAAPSITTTSVPGATQGQTGYSTTLAETGGTSPLTWTLSSGSLPSGLSLSSAGVISGNVGSSATTQTFTVKVTDANGVFDTQSLTITVATVPSITTTSVPAADKGQTGYSATLAETGGTSPFTWTISSGSLPSGLSLSSAGVISGNVGSSATNSTFTVKVTDTKGFFATQPLTLTVNAAPSITTTTVPGATQGQTGYSTTLAETGGTSPLTWTLSSGSLPSGLSLSSAGVISGNVGSSATNSTFTVKVTDANGVFDTQSLTLTVTAAPTPTITSLNPSSVQTSFSSQNVDVTITGTNFVSGATVAFNEVTGSDVTVNSVTFNSTTSLTAHISVDSFFSGGRGTFSVVVTNPSGKTSNGSTFTTK